MSSQPHSLNSSSINPANLLELQVLTKVIGQLQSNGDIQGSIPYLAKVVQIIDHQQLDRPSREVMQTDPKRKAAYYEQLNELRKVKAEAYAQLADAYFKVHNFISCETYLLFSVKIWENLIEHERLRIDSSYEERLKIAYKQLLDAYEAMGKSNLAYHIKVKLKKLTKKEEESL
ncbi:uncharacterized protein BX663DRAFT_553635 [Cokeromyces recurvatus]|uniref:uncharacterized protein n=1 Tax=Cokeromyces recurvatus TaxID=90255 RepID=UPI00221FC0DF|nr:uncharacterized protein BX663DRAFT_553635 [Cokeromyces recurvatus]KAI7900998.1 hypothetical protein BX663DRAFT_553635 [Cokeromyces recurvatus]